MKATLKGKEIKVIGKDAIQAVFTEKVTKQFILKILSLLQKNFVMENFMVSE